MHRAEAWGLCSVGGECDCFGWTGTADSSAALRNDKHNGRRMTENKSLVGIGLVAEDFFAADLGDEEGFAGQVGDWGA